MGNRTCWMQCAPIIVVLAACGGPAEYVQVERPTACNAGTQPAVVDATARGVPVWKCLPQCNSGWEYVTEITKNLYGTEITPRCSQVCPAGSKRASYVGSVGSDCKVVVDEKKAAVTAPQIPTRVEESPAAALMPVPPTTPGRATASTPSSTDGWAQAPRDEADSDSAVLDQAEADLTRLEKKPEPWGDTEIQLAGSISRRLHESLRSHEELDPRLERAAERLRKLDPRMQSGLARIRRVDAEAAARKHADCVIWAKRFVQQVKNDENYETRLDCNAELDELTRNHSRCVDDCLARDTRSTRDGCGAACSRRLTSQ